VEDLEADIIDVDGFELQWGHSDDAVEDFWPAWPLFSATIRFNGATAMTLWKTAKQILEEIQLELASMGPQR